MTRSSYLQEEDEDDAEDVATVTDDISSHREGKLTGQKPSNYRSKHSETEQRRRNKINERFQILRELIPPNDQKRDKASLLLKVIEYIQYLQEKLQVYEGSYQPVWNQEPTQLLPWVRANHGPVDNVDNHSPAMKNGSSDDDNVAQHMTHGSFESEFCGEFAYRGADLLAGPATPAIPFGVPCQSRGFAPGRCALPTENLVSRPPLSSIAERSMLGNENAYNSSSSSISNDYSQGVLKKLSQALWTSGVDLSQANISVQLDVAKQEYSSPMAGAAAAAAAGDVGISAMESVQAVKRLRTGES